MDCVEVPINLQGKQFTRMFLAVKGMRNHQVILGYDMMSEEGLVVDAADDKVYLKEQKTTHEWRNAEITVTAKTTLWPRTVQHVKVAAMTGGRTLEAGQTGIVFPRPSQKLGVWETLNTTGDRGTMTVAVVNMSKQLSLIHI